MHTCTLSTLSQRLVHDTAARSVLPKKGLHLADLPRLPFLPPLPDSSCQQGQSFGPDAGGLVAAALSQHGQAGRSPGHRAREGLLRLSGVLACARAWGARVAPLGLTGQGSLQ